MVDSAGLVQRIVVETISFVQALFAAHTPNADVAHQRTKAVLTNILRLCKNFLAVLDEKKAIAYKLAIVNEFLEYIRAETGDVLAPGFVTLDHDIYRLQEYLKLIAADPVKQQILLAQVTAGVNHFIDPDSIQPPTVVFWLKEACTMDAVKKMQTFMLFLSKQDHARVLEHDVTLLQDHNVQFLLECLQGF